MRRFMSKAVLLVGALLASLLISTTPAAADVTSGLYKTAYSPTLYYVTEGGETLEVTYEAWEEAGFPAPQPSPTDYVKYSWAPTIYAVTYWPDEWMWDPLDYPQWAQAGYPNPRIAGYIDGTTYRQWLSSSEIFAITEADNVIHKLTFAEWEASGYQSPTLTQVGFYKLSWNPSQVIAAAGPGIDTSVPIGFDEWSQLAFPTPALVQRIQGDEFWKYEGEDQIYYNGPTVEGDYEVSAAEWAAAGSPTPTIEP